MKDKALLCRLVQVTLAGVMQVGLVAGCGQVKQPATTGTAPPATRRIVGWGR